MGAAKWLIRHGAQTIITDLKNEVELEESMNLIMEWYEKYRLEYPDRTVYSPVFVLGEHRAEDFLEADCVVMNPGVPSESEFIAAARKVGVPIESDVSLFFRYCPYEIIAVTGTKGKTTTTKMIGEMLKVQDEKAIIAGNINISPLEFLDELLAKKQEHLIVLELSSWMLESLPHAFKERGKGTQIAVLTNVYPDHLNRYHSFGHYVHSKEIIFEWQSSDQFTVLNWDQETVRLMGERAKGQVFWCSKTYQKENGCYVKDGAIVFRRDQKDEVILPVAELGLKGDHNLENVLTSIAAAKLRGVETAIIKKIATEFKGVSNRQELVREVDEITYINDTTATNPDAVLAALNHFGADSDIILIAGGMDKALKYEELGNAIASTCKSLVLFQGDASDMIEMAVGARVPIKKGIKTMKEAVQMAKGLAASGDIVLLSPGATSFNMFKNEFDRGEQFREEVRNL